MSGTATGSWTTYVGGEAVELPATIDGIAAVLPPERREVFLDEVHATAAGELELLLGHWALETRPDIRAADEAMVERLKAGDFSGFTPAEDITK